MVKTILIGHLGKDAVVNEVSGRKVINFSVAHTEKFKDANGVANERTMWLECAWWRDNTIVAQYLTKGTQVYVEGTPSVSTYTNRDNKIVAQLRVRVQDVKLLGSRKDAAPNTTVTAQESNAIGNSFKDGDLVDDLPF